MSKFLSPRLKCLEAYTPGEQPRDKKYVKLNTNESPFSPSPEVIEAVNSKEVSMLNLYSDPTCKLLREKLACRYGVEPDMVFVSNGSDDILNFSFMAFCDKEKGMAYPDISYGFYKVFAALHTIKSEVKPLSDDFSVNVDDYCNLDCNIVIANPNAPTGLSIELSEIRRILDSNRDNVVIIDEAYVDFGGESALALVPEYDNLLVVRTFSKSRSLAGARLGFAIGNKDLIADLELIKYSTNPYDINRLTQVAGCAAIDSDEYYFNNVKTIIENRAYTTEKLTEMDFEVIDSKANFVFARHKRVEGEKLYTKLRENGVLVRHFSGERIKNYLRITIGTIEEMEILINTVKKILAEEGTTYEKQ